MGSKAETTERKRENDERILKLESLDSFAREINLPGDIMPGIVTGRPELLRLVNRPLSAPEARHVLNALGTLMETNRLLREHCMEVEGRMTEAQQAAAGFVRSLQSMRDLLNFKRIGPNTSDD